MKPLVSILIPAYNAERWIGDAIRSALQQTWSRKEVIVVDDGSRDRTVEFARRFVSPEVQVVTVPNAGAAAARNHAYSLSQGDYIQWLDADDILAADKLEKQLLALRESDGSRMLLSSAWAPFYYRSRKAEFIRTSLCQDLSPGEWLLHKMQENLHMQTATWLTSRELAEAAGPWNTRLLSDDDGEYFCRVLLQSSGVRFVPGTGVYYRITATGRLSDVGDDRKKDALLSSMKLHVQYLRSLEDSERSRKACLTYMQNWYGNFYPDRPDLMEELQRTAAELDGHLQEPHLRWKYAWLRPVLGWETAKRAQVALPRMKSRWLKQWDQALYWIETRGMAGETRASAS
jgi:glycosyltransferase involved in cell wall biosynthesis